MIRIIALCLFVLTTTAAHAEYRAANANVNPQPASTIWQSDELLASTLGFGSTAGRFGSQLLLVKLTKADKDDPK